MYLSVICCIIFLLFFYAAQSHVDVILEAMDWMNSHTCVKFQPWRGENDYIKFILGNGYVNNG